MSIPPSLSSVEGLSAVRDRMSELEETLRKVFPAHFFEFLTESEIGTVQWHQDHDREVEPDIEFDFLEDEAEALDARMERLNTATKKLLESIPICVLVELFGDDHEVTFHRDGFSSYSRDYGSEIDDSLRSEYPKDPSLGSLEELLQEFDSLREQVAESLTGHMQRVLDETPEISALRWVQYSPGFNDGDICSFSLQEEPEACWGAELSDGMFEEFEPLSEVLYAVHSEVLLRLFGDHKRVTFHAGSFTAQDYNEYR